MSILLVSVSFSKVLKHWASRLSESEVYSVTDDNILFTYIISILRLHVVWNENMTFTDIARVTDKSVYLYDIARVTDKSVICMI